MVGLLLPDHHLHGRPSCLHGFHFHVLLGESAEFTEHCVAYVPGDGSFYRPDGSDLGSGSDRGREADGGTAPETHATEAEVLAQGTADTPMDVARHEKREDADSTVVEAATQALLKLVGHFWKSIKS